MKTVVIFLLFAAVALKATAAPAEELVKMVEVKEEPKPEAEKDLSPLAPEVISQYCLPNWEFYRGKCYFFSGNLYTWRTAVDYCANFGATLASVHSPLEYNHLQYMVGRARKDNAWTGGFHFENSWRWQDGSYFDYYNFMSGGSGTTYKCLRMNSQAGQGWFSSSCNNAAPFICQININC